LPRYAYDPRLRGAKYVDLARNRIVSESTVTDLLRDWTKGSESRLQVLGELYANKEIDGRQFYEFMTREIRLSVNTQTALASGGWGQISNKEWGYNGFICREQYKDLREFIEKAEAGDLSAAQIVQRARLYANRAYERFWEIETEKRKNDGEQRERVVTVGDDRVCPECRGAEAQGWQPIGQFSVPLHPGCRCDKQFATQAETKVAA
jgi:hypothetical protein